MTSLDMSCFSYFHVFFNSVSIHTKKKQLSSAMNLIQILEPFFQVEWTIFLLFPNLKSPNKIPNFLQNPSFSLKYEPSDSPKFEPLLKVQRQIVFKDSPVNCATFFPNNPTHWLGQYSHREKATFLFKDLALSFKDSQIRNSLNLTFFSQIPSFSQPN